MNDLAAMIKLNPPRLFISLAAIAGIIKLASHISSTNDPASLLWATASPWTPTAAEHLQVQTFLSFEESLVSLQDAEWLGRQVSRLDKDSPLQAYELDVAAIRVATSKDVFAAKKRAYELGDTRRARTAIFRPLASNQFALTCSKYGDIGPLLFKIDRLREPAAYAALQLLSELLDQRPK